MKTNNLTSIFFGAYYYNKELPSCLLSALTVEHRIEIGRHGCQDHSMGVDGVASHLQANIAELKRTGEWWMVNGGRRLLRPGVPDVADKVSLYKSD